jgi:hypothetical protein
MKWNVFDRWRKGFGVIAACAAGWGAVADAQTLTGSGSEKGGLISGVESLRIVARLMPVVTSSASPIGGSVTLSAVDNQGTTTGSIIVDSTGLLPGGSYTVTAMTNGTTAFVGGVYANTPPNQIVFGDGGAAFPKNFNLMAVQSITITVDEVQPNCYIIGSPVSSTPSPAWSGSFTDVSTVLASEISTDVAVTSGTAAPNAQGELTILGRVHADPALGELFYFHLYVENLPPNISAIVAFDGKDVATVRVDRQGRLVIDHNWPYKPNVSLARQVPSGFNLFTGRSLSIRRADGTQPQLASVNF